MTELNELQWEKQSKRKTTIFWFIHWRRIEQALVVKASPMLSERRFAEEVVHHARFVAIFASTNHRCLLNSMLDRSFCFNDKVRNEGLDEQTDWSSSLLFSFSSNALPSNHLQTVITAAFSDPIKARLSLFVGVKMWLKYYLFYWMPDDCSQRSDLDWNVVVSSVSMMDFFPFFTCWSQTSLKTNPSSCRWQSNNYCMELLEIFNYE